eukprot:403346446
MIRIEVQKIQEIQQEKQNDQQYQSENISSGLQNQQCFDETLTNSTTSDNLLISIQEYIYEDTVEGQLKQRLQLKPDSQIVFENGHEVDLASLQSLHIPSLKTFKFVRYYKEQSKRWIQIFLCEHENCTKQFKKWHNLFDHLRSHTQEKPFVCPVDGCSQPFTQRSNLNKHMKIHKNKCYLKCSECKKFFTKSKLLNHFLTHQGLVDQDEDLIENNYSNQINNQISNEKYTSLSSDANTTQKFSLPLEGVENLKIINMECGTLNFRSGYLI